MSPRCAMSEFSVRYYHGWTDGWALSQVSLKLIKAEKSYGQCSSCWFKFNTGVKVYHNAPILCIRISL